MRSKHFLGLSLAVGGFAALGLVTGCGGETTVGTTSSGAGGDSSSSGSTMTTSAATTSASTTTTGATTTSAVTTTTGTTMSSGTGGAAPGDSFDTAIGIDINSVDNTIGALLDGDAKVDYYKFTGGLKGQRITAVVSAQGLFTDAGHDPNDVTVIDTVVTIYDAARKQIAQDDDAWPRFSTDSQLFTVLPADGDYYVTVTNFCTAFPLVSGGCDNVGGLGTFDYELFIADVNKLNSPEVNETTTPNKEPNNDAMNASKFTYAVPSGGMAGSYGIYTFDGNFVDATDVDVFALSVPLDTKFDATQRAHAEFWIQPITPDGGTGAAANAVYSLTDATGGVLAQVDQKNYSNGASLSGGPIDMSVPVEGGKTYYLFVKHPGGTADPVKDFYFLKHYVGSFYYGQFEGVAMAPPPNDTVATAQPLALPMGSTNLFVDGDISLPTDVDYYAVPITATTKKVNLYCDAQRAGSGLRGAKFSLLDSAGVAIPGTSSFTEVADQDLSVGGANGLTIPAASVTAGKILLKVETTSQDPTVKGTFYHCSVILN
jgi:hypothetical protein